MLIGTNGRIAEMKYLKALKAEAWVRRRAVVVFVGGSPMQLVEAIASRAERDDYDEVWVVCDVDTFDVAEAHVEAARRGVAVVLSTPCFELWLILHFAECTAFIENGKKCGEKLQQHLPNWNKLDLRFDDFREGVMDATRRAKSLGDPPSSNPSTHMWRVVEALTDDAGP